MIQALDGKDPEHKAFWEALSVVADAELKEAVRQEEADRARLRGESAPDAEGDRGTLHSAVDTDIHILLAGVERAPTFAAPFPQEPLLPLQYDAFPVRIPSHGFAVRLLGQRASFLQSL
jgi:hypothetical protein